jgi:peroxiredoxin
VDLQRSERFRKLGVALLSISPDSVQAWREVATANRIATPVLSDRGNRVAESYGVMRWGVDNRPGHTFVLVGAKGTIRSIRDYGAPENGGLMYVDVADVVGFVENDLSAGNERS